MANLERLVKNLDIFLARADSGEDKILLPRQLVTMHKIHDFIKAGYTEGHITLPTGVGKTVIFTKFLEAALADPKSKGLVVGPTKIISHQNRWKLEEFGGLATGAYYGSQKDNSQNLTVTTYSSLRNSIESGIIKPEEYSFLILDEAHRALGEKTISVIDQFPESTIKLGFTATPEFHEQKSVADILPVSIDELSLREAIRSNLLAGLQVYLVKTSQDASSLSLTGKEYESSGLNKILNTDSRNNFIVSLYKERPEFQGLRTVVYCAGISHARDMAQAFSNKGISAGYVDSQTDDITRENLFGSFKNGKVQVLCNAEVLIEGFDEPEAEICLNAAPTLSRVVAEQRGGRVLRRSKYNDGKIGKVVEIIDDFGASQNTPVLFSEVAGAAEILPENFGEKITKKISKRERKESTKVEVSQIITDPDLIMAFTNKNKHQRFTKDFHYAPSGWEHARQLAHDCGVRESTIQLFAETQNLEDKKLARRYLTSTDVLMTHYHPELVDTIRRRFIPSLDGMIVPEQYAVQAGLPNEKAKELLRAAGEITATKPKHFSTASYYPRKESVDVIENERKLVNNLEQEAVTEAEDIFWNDDERTDEQREKDYWESFEHLSPDLKDLDKPSYKTFTLPFNDGSYQSQPSSPTLNENDLHKLDRLNRNLQFLTESQRMVLHERFHNSKTLRGIANQYNTTPENVRKILLTTFRRMREYVKIDESFEEIGFKFPDVEAERAFKKKYK